MSSVVLISPYKFACKVHFSYIHFCIVFPLLDSSIYLTFWLNSLLLVYMQISFLWTSTETTYLLKWISTTTHFIMQVSRSFRIPDHTLDSFHISNNWFPSRTWVRCHQYKHGISKHCEIVVQQFSLCSVSQSRNIFVLWVLNMPF